MPAATMTVGNAEITAILDVETSIPLSDIFDGSGEPPPGGTEALAVRYPDEFTPDTWRFRDHCFLVLTPGRLTLIDAVIGKKKKLEIEIANLRDGRYPPDMFAKLQLEGLMGDDEEYWPFEGEHWSDEYDNYK